MVLSGDPPAAGVRRAGSASPRRKVEEARVPRRLSKQTAEQTLAGSMRGGGRRMKHQAWGFVLFATFVSGLADRRRILT